MVARLYPSTVPLEFLAWFGVWLAFAALQRSLCRNYPGLRSLCRMLFLATALIAVVPAIWTLAAQSGSGPRLLAACNHAFGLGILVQTSLRSLLLVRWLAWSGAHIVLGTAATLPGGAGSEPYLMASLLALSQVMRISPGLKLESKKATANIMVVDHVEKVPVEN